jgi:hypothetical protein
VRYWIALLGAGWVVTPATAQIDYRNLDGGRPTTVEDAYPLERYAFDLSGGYRYIRTGRGGSQQIFETELQYGIQNSLAVGVKAPLTAKGLAGLRVFALYNISTERPGLPGLAWRFDGLLPLGSEGGGGVASILQLLATRSFGRDRLHLNAGIGVNRPTRPAGAEAIPRWSVGLAVDRTLIRSSTLLVGEIAAEQETGDAKTGITAAVGFRRQMTPTVVLDAGLSLGVARGERSRPAVTLGVSHTFGIAGLMPGGKR